MTFPTALVLHPDCGRHDPGWGHPEHQGRLPAIVAAIHAELPDLHDRVLQREAEPATEADLLLCHTEEHLELVRRAAATAESSGEQVALDPDTVVSGASWDAALASAGCAVTATRLVLAGEASTAFAATRPPGHHATGGRPMGFCLFNNVAVAARVARQEGIERVLILDWDVHHGNGTQDIFYSDGSVFYVSFHLAPHYPGTGAPWERGEGEGEGANLNVPLRRGTSRAAYLDRFRTTLQEVAADFRPQLVLVSAGFDVLAGDPLGGLGLEPEDLHTMTRAIMEAARGGAGGRVAVVLEGGYEPKRVGQGVVQVVRALAGRPPRSPAAE